MATKTPKPESAIDDSNRHYYEQQAATHAPFRSPFAALNATVADCVQMRADIGMSDEALIRDMAIFNRAIENYISEHGYPETNDKVDACLILAFEFVKAGMRDDNYPQSHWPLVACHAALATLKSAQDTKTFRIDAAMTNVALFAQMMMNIAWKPERLRRMEDLARGFAQLANDQQETNRILNAANHALAPLAAKGDKFRPGRKKGTLSKTALRIQRHLSKHPAAKALEVWGALSATPERSYVYRNSPQLGRYIEDSSTGKTIMEWPRFRNLVSQHRPAKG